MIITVKCRCNKTACRYFHTMKPAIMQHYLRLMHTDETRPAPATGNSSKPQQTSTLVCTTVCLGHLRLLENSHRLIKREAISVRVITVEKEGLVG